jgi:hypothetical protein
VLGRLRDSANLKGLLNFQKAPFKVQIAIRSKERKRTKENGQGLSNLWKIYKNHGQKFWQKKIQALGNPIF